MYETMGVECLFFHIDIDAFYATVELLDNPQYEGKPLIVGGQGRRGVVSTCSYQARKKGIISGMPMYEAKKKLPTAIFLACRMERYKDVSNKVMNMLKRLAPSFQQISIDEAFLDMTGMERLFGSPIVQANRIKEYIKTETGITVSIGGGSNKYVAKIASAFSKPDGLVIVPRGNEEEFIKNIPLSKVWGIGKKTLIKLNNMSITSTLDVLKLSKERLIDFFGISFASFIYTAVRGGSSSTFKAREKVKSISVEHTFDFDEDDLACIDDLIFQQADEVVSRLIQSNLTAKTVFIKIIYKDFSKKELSETGEYLLNTSDLYNRIKKIFVSSFEFKKLRLLGLGVRNIKYSCNDLQESLFVTRENRKEAEYTVRRLQRNNNIKLARLLKRTCHIKE